MPKIGSTTIAVVRGSVTDQKVDAIVNAANTLMRGGGGIDARIHLAAGPQMLLELIRVAPFGARVGEPKVTAAYRLPQKFVIHVAGPRWRGGNKGEPEQLAAAYRNSLAAADERGLESIAFCSISTGIYGYPLDLAAPLALGVAIEYAAAHPGTKLRRVVFSLYGEHEYELFLRASEAAEAKLQAVASDVPNG